MGHRSGPPTRATDQGHRSATDQGPIGPVSSAILACAIFAANSALNQLLCSQVRTVEKQDEIMSSVLDTGQAECCHRIITACLFLPGNERARSADLFALWQIPARLKCNEQCELWSARNCIRSRGSRFYTASAEIAVCRETGHDFMAGSLP